MINCRSFLKQAFLWTGFSLTMLSPSYAQQASFRSFNFPELFIRHASFWGFVAPIEASDMTGRKDASFWVRPGLAGSCGSFESVNLPGFFLRHQNFRIILSKFTSDRQFQEDATFCTKDGLADRNARSFESFNLRNHYIRHSNFELWLRPAEGGDLFKQDATFNIQWVSLAASTLQSAVTTRIERHQLGAWVHISGTGFSSGQTVRFRVEGLTGMAGPKSIGVFANVRPDGSFGEASWDGRTWPNGGNARLRALDQATGLSATAPIPPLH